jgi:hypothetical protein
VYHGLRGTRRESPISKGFLQYTVGHGFSKKRTLIPLKSLAIPAGFEPATHGVEIRYSRAIDRLADRRLGLRFAGRRRIAGPPAYMIPSQVSHSCRSAGKFSCPPRCRSRPIPYSSLVQSVCVTEALGLRLVVPPDNGIWMMRGNIGTD